MEISRTDGMQVEPSPLGGPRGRSPRPARGRRLFTGRGMLAAAAVFAACAACGASDTPECRVGADCVSGACSRAGRCLPAPGDGGAGEVEGADGAAAGTDAGAVGPDGGHEGDGGHGGGDAGGAGADGGLASCLPNADGLLERRELPIAAGLHATYRTTLDDVSVDTGGTPTTGGRRRWDFSASLSGDRRVELTTEPVAGKWYAADFPSATYASRLSEGSPLLGVFRATDTSLLLLGVVSPDQGLTFTRLSYDPPVEVLQFPLGLGRRWATDAWVTGFYDGLTVGLGYAESYAYEVTAAGEAVVPLSTRALEVLRLSVELTKTVGLLVTTTRTHSFLAECLGPVAVVVSSEGEPNLDFTTAAELRRLAP